jgi:hypothetical protein
MSAQPYTSNDDKEKPATSHLENVLSYDDALEKQPAALHGKVENMDEAAQVMANAGKVEYTLAEDKAVLRKIDTWILPVLCLVYWVQQLDKSSVSYAAVFDLREYFHRCSFGLSDSPNLRGSDALEGPAIQLADIHRLHCSTRLPAAQFVCAREIPRQVVGLVQLVWM